MENVEKPFYKRMSKKKLYESWHYWEESAKQSSAEAKYYRNQLSKAHEVLGRVIHQLSERWDSVNLTEYYPTDNLWRKRTSNNPTGKKGE